MQLNIQHNFNFTFEKTSKEINDAASKKIEALNAKIEERQARIAKIREDYKIDDKAFIGLLQEARRDAQRHMLAASYSISNSSMAAGSPEQPIVIGAGLVQNILTEGDLIEQEKANVKRLEILVRNLRPLKKNADGDGTPYVVDAFTLSYDELDYFGF